MFAACFGFDLLLLFTGLMCLGYLVCALLFAMLVDFVWFGVILGLVFACSSVFGGFDAITLVLA